MTFNQVKEILAKLGFEENDVLSWNQPIKVPLGASTNLFVAREAILNGSPFKNIRNLKKVQLISPEKFALANVIKSFPKSMKKPGTNQDPIKVLESIEYKFPEGERLYGGIRTWELITPFSSGRNSILIIFDWSDSGSSVQTKILSDLEWAATVKEWDLL
ncbi:hypothetical protein C1645_829483 [Glomus cerebriforme]|uniref:Uncharacterized protein n=1 Tax=Glomus cerebriforme TaxID=658196 RepID=A0A397SQU3_9GLOM|nr:hypothetical protein C1645_829483 [Glomus cerebriforme]